MPAHVRSVLTQTSIGMPIHDGRLALGTWQGVYLWEHRTRPHRRKITVDDRVLTLECHTRPIGCEAMVVLSNRHLGPSVELLLSTDVAAAIVRETAEAARPVAAGRWEHELVRWLEGHAGEALDVGDIAWTPEHFDSQRAFLVDAIERARWSPAPTPRILRRWARS